MQMLDIFYIFKNIAIILHCGTYNMTSAVTCCTIYEARTVAQLLGLHISFYDYYPKSKITASKLQ